MSHVPIPLTGAASAVHLNYKFDWRARSDAALAFWAIAAFTLLRLILSQSVGFGVDESYTLSISRQLAGSYFDHPPLHLWIAHFSQVLFGQGRMVRLPFVLLSAASSWLMFRFTASLFGGRAGLWAVLAFNLSGFFSLAAGEWVLPDGPLNFCLLAAALNASRIVANKQGKDDLVHWLGIGFWIGVSALAKYHALVFGLGLLGFFATTLGQGYWYGRRTPYSAVLLAIVLFVPVLVWNAQHGWVSVVFHLSRGDINSQVRLTQLLEQIGGEIGFLFPWIAVPLAMVMTRTLMKPGRSDGEKLCLWLALPNIVFFTLTPLWGTRGLPHWPMPGWLMVFPLLGAWLARADITRLWPRRLIAISAALFALLAVGTATDGATGWIGSTFLNPPNRDPTIELADWTAVPQFLESKGFAARKNTFLLAMDWQSAGKLDQATLGLMPVHVFPSAAHGYAFQRNAGGLAGQDALIVGTPLRMARHRAEIAGHFQSIMPVGKIFVGRNGRKELELDVYLATRLDHPLDVKAL